MIRQPVKESAFAVGVRIFSDAMTRYCAAEGGFAVKTSNRLFPHLGAFSKMLWLGRGVCTSPVSLRQSESRRAEADASHAACRCETVLVLLLFTLLSAPTLRADMSFTVSYSGQQTRAWNWSGGIRHRITLNAAGTVRVTPHQVTTEDGTSFVSYTADLVTSNHVWGTAIEDGSVPTYRLNFDVTRLVSRTPSSTYSHFTPQTASYLYFETEDSVYADPNDITVYAWEYVSSLNVIRIWVALEDPFYYPDASYEHYDFPATHVVNNASQGHSSLLGTVVDSQATAVPGAQVAVGGVSRTSDTQGKFQYDDIPPSNYLLTITKSGFNGFTNVETISAFSILQRAYTLGCTRLDVLGRVLDASTRQPLNGVSVALAGQNITTTGSGTYSFVNVCLGSGDTLSVAKSGYQTQELQVSPPADAMQYVIPDIYLATNGTFAVVSINPKYDGLFLSTASFMNEYTAVVDWGGRIPGAVEFYVNGSLASTVPTPDNEARADIDIGLEFFGSLNVGANWIEAVAVDSLGERSKSLEQAVKVIPFPALIGPQGLLLPFEFFPGNDPKMKWEFNFPRSFASAQDIRQIPFIGDIGADFNFDCHVDYSVLSGKWGVFAGEEWTKRIRALPSRRPNLPKFKLGNVYLDSRGGLKAEGVASQTRGFDVDRAGVEVEFGVKAEVGNYYVTDWVPFGGVVRLLDFLRNTGIDPNSIQRITVFGKLAAQINAMAEFKPDIHFGYLQVTLKPGVEAVYHPNVGLAQGEIIVGGGLGIEGELAPSLAWKKITGDIFLSVRFDVFGRERFKEKYVIVHGTIWEQGTTSKSLAGAIPLARIKIAGDDWLVFRVQPEPLGAPPRTYLRAGPERFVARGTAGDSSNSPYDTPALSAFHALGLSPVRGSATAESETNRQSGEPVFEPQGAGSGSSTNQVELTLVQNVFPESQPVMASREQELMLLYVADNGMTNDLQFTDIEWTHWDGTNWSVPEAIRTNTQAEFAPQVKYDGNGDAIAVWERVADQNFTNVDLTAMAAQMEIVWSRWNSDSGTWTEPQALTANSFLDHSPLLAGPMENGNLLLTWTKNEANLLLATNAPGSDTVIWSELSPASGIWSPPQVLVDGLAYRLSQSLAGETNCAAYAWTADADGVLTNDADQEVFFIAYTNGAWGTPQQFTTNDIADKNVRLAVSGSADTYLIWQSETNLVMDRNFSGTNSLVRPDSQTAGFADYTMTLGPLGHLVLLWQETSQNGADAHYAVYDPASDTWSKDDLLCDDPPLERSFAPAWDGVGNLTVAYNKAEILHTNLTLELEGGGTVTITNVPQPGRVDLVVTKRALIKDLALLAGDFTVQGLNYLPGDPLTLTALVRNTGNVAVSNVVASFFDGDPDSGGVLLTNVTLPGWLEAASTNTATALWIVTEPAANHALYAVVDRADLETEYDEANNLQSLNIGGTDLSVALVSYSAETNGALRVIAQVKNLGAPGATNSVLAIWREGVTNAPLATASVPSLAPGRLAQVPLDLPPGTQPEGESIYRLFADEAQVVEDVDTNNNTTAFAVNLWLDTDGDGMPDDWEAQYSFLSPTTAADAALDYDGDGLSNYAEYRAGTAPDDPLSYLRMTGIGGGGTNGVAVAWGSATNKLYTLQRATTLWPPGFTNIAEHILSTPPENVYLDVTATNIASLFYRVRVE